MKTIYTVTGIYAFDTTAEIIAIYENDFQAIEHARDLQGERYGDYEAFVVEALEIGKFYDRNTSDDPKVIKVFELEN